MTNREKFIEVFGDNPQRHNITKSWWDEEYVPPQEPKTEKVIKMRDATPEERESIEKYVKSISKPTGVDFWDLEHEPCEDAISREKAKQFLYERLDRLNDDELYDIFSRIIDDMYNELPPVNPQRTGHWIRGHHGFGGSNCHKSIEGEWDDNIDDITGTLFCPNCGARMVEKQESEEQMGKCRYDLSEDCHKKDCLDCVLDKIRAEIVEEAKCTMNENRAGGLYKALQIIDKYRGE